MQYEYLGMLTTGEMAKKLQVDRRTLISWVNSGVVKCSRHPVNGYRYFKEQEVINSLRVKQATVSPVDEPGKSS